MTGTPFNKYCIDCKKKKTSHFLVWLGTYVCKNCAEEHSQLGNSTMSTCYVKDVYGEHWDDYQLKSIQIGGNRKIFEGIFKKYELTDFEFSKKYKHPAVKWYIQKHKFLMDGGNEDEFYILPPGVNRDEKIENLKKRYDLEVK